MIKNVIFPLLFCFLSFQVVSVEVVKKDIKKAPIETSVKFDSRQKILEAAELSTSFDIQSIIDRTSEVDLGRYNIDGIRDMASANLDDKQFADDVIDSFSDIAADPENARTMSKIQSLSGIANADMAAKREEVLNFLGLSDLRNHMYIFVSYSMPVDMIKAYSREAMWSGASLVVKGIQEDEEMGDFVQKQARELLGDKGYAAALHIDPRLFEAFDISYVPTVVVADENFIDYCAETSQPVVSGTMTKVCGPRPEDRYAKVSGAVTVDYALELMVEKGVMVEHAQERLDVLRQNLGKPSYTEQVSAFDYSDELTPEQKMKLHTEYSKFGTVKNDGSRMVIEPFELDKSGGIKLKRNK